MGGDSPLDFLYPLAEAVGVECDFDTDEETFHGFPFTRELLEGSLKEIYKSLREHKDCIYGQVVGATFLWAGAEMPEELKSRVIADAEKDEWAASGDEERKRYIHDFIEAVENHEPGQRVELSTEGLFERMAKVLGER
jgi:hypothetical protein